MVKVVKPFYAIKCIVGWDQLKRTDKSWTRARMIIQHGRFTAVIFKLIRGVARLYYVEDV